jgi:MFS superfamily sulfate permease-like transporter
MRGVRYVYILALVVWLGGMVVLGVVVAPATFQTLQAIEPTTGRELGGAVFTTILERFHYVAYASGTLLLLTLAVMAVLGPRPRRLAVRVTLITTMLAVALYSGFVVLRGADGIRREVGGLPSRLPEGDARRVRFDELHALSTRLMMVNIVGALALLFWVARE